MTRATYIRNPYAVPDLSKEGSWIRGGPELGKKVIVDDEDWKRKVTPHERLFAHQTLNSTRRHAKFIRLKEPKDCLDFALATIYVHSKDTMLPKNMVKMQLETLGKDTWRQLRNKLKVPPKPPPPPFSIPKKATKHFVNPGFEWAPAKPLTGKTICYYGPIVERRIHPSNVKLNIIGPLSDKSNPGFSRKVDGTYFGI
ncbi:cilia- and flagella-associated protein 276 [Prorops nasuta]|uniref:cilia- and flagella-associated protein 276 n=1 Tax=Prorops nasuta TaxID=863751 RepID=UPI0034CEFE85